MEYRWIRTGMANLQCSNFQTCLVVLGSFGRGRARKLGTRGLCVSSGALLRRRCVGEEADHAAASERKRSRVDMEYGEPSALSLEERKVEPRCRWRRGGGPRLHCRPRCQGGGPSLLERNCLCVMLASMKRKKDGVQPQVQV